MVESEEDQNYFETDKNNKKFANVENILRMRRT